MVFEPGISERTKTVSFIGSKMDTVKFARLLTPKTIFVILREHPVKRNIITPKITGLNFIITYNVLRLRKVGLFLESNC